jgi:hypothetical protein
VLPALTYLSASLPPLPSTSEPFVDGVHGYERTDDLATGVHTALLTLGDDKIWCRVKENEPANASLEIAGSRVETQGERRIEARAEGSLRSTVESLIMDIECTLLENGRVVRSGSWKDEVRRELV